MKVIRLPKVALALVTQDRLSFYRQLHENESIIYIEEERLWLVYKYDHVAALLKDTNLSSNRFEISVRSFSLANIKLFESFYRQWIMYSDGEVHKKLRKLFIQAANSFDTQSFVSEIQDTVFRLFENANRVENWTEELIQPFVIHSLSVCAGIDRQSFLQSIRIIEPLLQVLHGRSLNTSITTEVINQSLQDWEDFVSILQVKENGVLRSLINGTSDLSITAAGVLPFIDVVDAMVSICSHIAADVLNQTKDNCTTAISVNECMIMYSPFQVCNRIIAGKINLFQEIEYQLGDKVSLLIGAANLDPVKIKGNSVAGDDNSSFLSFGLGSHSCPGRNFSLLILESFRQAMLKFRASSDQTFTTELKYNQSWSFTGIDKLTVKRSH